MRTHRQRVTMWMAVMLAALALPALRAQEPAGAANAAAAEPTLQDRLDRLCAQLEQQRQSLHIPGLAIAIVKDDAVILSKGLGVRDLDQNVPVTPATQFAIGSSSKAFTAALCAMLVDEGKMAWDDLVTSHLPQFRLHDEQASQQITIRDLLCHRSGLTRTDLVWASGGAEPAEILAAIANAEPTAKFREKFQYQNVMFLAAGMAAANAAGEPGGWDALVAKRIFQPLGMNRSNTSIQKAMADPDISLGYVWDEHKSRYNRKPMRDLHSIAPAGAINSNVIDMAQWLRLQLNRGEVDGQRLLSAERFDEMWTKQISLAGSPEAEGGEVAYGLGWMLQEWQGKRVIQHGGNIDGFAAQVALIPEQRLGYVLLTNVTATPLQTMSISMVFDALLGPWSQNETPPLDPSAVQDCLGKYRMDVLNTDVTVLLKDGKLAIDVPGQMVFTLKPPQPPAADGKWVFELTDSIALAFNRDSAGKVMSLTLFQSGLKFECPKEGVTLPVEISLDDAQKYLGAYHDDRLQADVTVLHRNGRLAVDVPRQMVYELRLPDADGKWLLRIKDDLAVKFLEDAQGEVIGLTFFESGVPFNLPRVATVEKSAVPSLEEVLALHGAGCGSQDLRSLGLVRITARLSMPNQGITDASLVVICNGLDQFMQHIDLGRFGWIKIGLTGDAGWTDSSFEPAEELPKDVAGAMRLQNPLMCSGDWRSSFDRVEIVTLQKLDEREVVAVQLNAGDSVRCTALVDRECGHVPRIEYSTPIPGVGSIRTTELLTDWREVKGVYLPFRWQIENDLYGKTIVQVQNVETGIALPPGAFAMPKRSDRHSE